ncbi:MAG: hypothetical protein HY211_00790 [Candidatus Omnitrophica bacterium]|nr:hypothetical protein [Candidatus Omnitrophota bacterium]
MPELACPLPRPRKKQGWAGSGFALVEVLTAAVVLTIGVAAMMGVLVMALHGVQSAGERLEAMGRLEAEAVDLRARVKFGEGVAPGRLEGSWPHPSGAAWEATIREGLPNLLTVDLRAHWSRSGRLYGASLSTAMPALSQVEGSVHSETSQ